MAVVICSIRLRLKDKHAAELNRQAVAVNVVWNYCNETQQKAAQSGRRWLNDRTLRKLTAGTSKLLDLHSHTIQQVCIFYDRARFHHKRAWLRFRTNKSLGWVPFCQGANGVTINKHGHLRFRRSTYEPMHWRTLPAGALIRTGSFNRDARGRWYITMRVEMPAVSKAPNASVGVDLGLDPFATLSNGVAIRAPQFYRNREAQLIRLQRARKKKQLKTAHAAIRNSRVDFLHKESTKIAENFSLIVVGDVSPTQLVHTNRRKSVRDAAWYNFKRMLSYKALRHGGCIVEVSERMTSQLCSDCGVVGGPKGIAQLRIREWTCGGCGATHDRDVNAARNILARGLASLEEGAAKERSSQGWLVTNGVALPWVTSK